MPRTSQSKVSVLKVLPVFRPAMGQAEIDAVAEVIRSGWIGLGPKTEEFENKFAKYVDSDYAVGLNSATAALHLSLLALGIGKGDEVLVPSLTFVSDAHAVLYVGARPVFVDIDEETLCMDPADLKRKITKKSKAVIPVDFGGHPVDLDEIQRIAKKHNLKVIEDASHACGSQYKGKMIGGLSDLTCFSFHAVKNLATGDGGMVTTNDKDLADRIRRLRWVGIDKATWEREEKVLSEDYRQYGWYYDVVDLGYKYHMNDLTAAIGIAQLKKLKKANRRRKFLAKRYDDHFRQLKWLKIPIVKDWAESARHNYVIKTRYRDRLNLLLKDRLISSGVHYMPIHHHKYYRQTGYTANVPVTERVWKTLLTLPLYPTLSFRDQDRVINAIQEFGKTL
ncbi:DegT/DnrJ/EryC1/StrS aminotransferase family protein [Candidatus Collierbacteria bacterium]|nr:DegT/DnrJ/EryC1/StrS aminotransferase family protein [Candidatus Collierbacteria bacterium]